MSKQEAAFSGFTGSYRGLGTVPGMTLRDYFAAKAMHALLRNSTTFEKGLHITREDYAVEAYRQADAMLSARTPTRQ